MQSRKQAGFFDAGLSALVLAFSGLFIWAVESDHAPVTTDARHQQIEQADARVAEAYSNTLSQ